MNKPLRVLQAIVANDRGGLTGYICQNYRYIDKSKVQFDFITYDDRLDFEEDFNDMGAKFYRFPKAYHIISYYKKFYSIQEEMEYSVVHFNMSYANIIPLIIAKAVGIKRVIMHSHSTQIDSKNLLVRGLKTCFHYVCKNFLPIVADEYYACSTEAAQWMYPSSIINSKKYYICKNAINIDRFVYNALKRKEKRSELGISDSSFVLGHIGRFTYQKNHEFLIKVFSEVQKNIPHAVLILVGIGKLEDEIRELVKLLNVKNVLFLGQREDVPELMQAMDVFLLPSRFEGLGIVGIEAQASGLPCYFSESVTKEVGITELAHFLSIKDARKWANAVINYENHNFRRNMKKEVTLAGYEICHEIRKIEKLYNNIYL